MPCENLVAGGFAHGTAPFASHQIDAQRAAAYLTCCVENQLTWSTVEGQVRQYLADQGVADTGINKQVAKVQRLFGPWLDTPDTDGENVVDLPRR